MSLVVTRHNGIRPDFLFEMMEKQRLLPEWVSINPSSIVDLANRCKVNTISEDEIIYAMMIEFIVMPGVKDLLVFVLDKGIMRRKDEIAELQDKLRANWFEEGMRRVQVSVPLSRKNTKRILLYMGFVQETRDCGLRNLMKYGPKQESCIIMGLLPSDPLRKLEVIEEPELTHADD